jgi:hypothetical protein
MTCSQQPRAVRPPSTEALVRRLEATMTSRSTPHTVVGLYTGYVDNFDATPPSRRGAESTRHPPVPLVGVGTVLVKRGVQDPRQGLWPN